MADQFAQADPTTLELIRKKIAEFLSGAGSEAKGVVTGLKDLATTNPIDTVKGAWEAQMKPFERAGKEYATGSKVDAAIHAANGMVPLMGPWVDDIATEMADTGNYAKGAGRAVGGTLAGEAIGKVAPIKRLRAMGATEAAPNLDVIAAKIKELTDKNQGATYNMARGDLAGTPNYAVSTFPEHSLTTPGAPDLEVIKKYLQQHSDLLKESDNSAGTWYDKEKNNFVTDIVKTLPDRQKAMDLGTQHGQDAIFDLGGMEEIRLPKGLSKADFATAIHQDPSLVNGEALPTSEQWTSGFMGGGQNDPVAIRKGLDAAPPGGYTNKDVPRGPGKLGKAAQDIAERRTQPFGRPPVGVTDRRRGEIAAGTKNAVPKIPIDDARYKELLTKFGMTEPPPEAAKPSSHATALEENVTRNSPFGEGSIMPSAPGTFPSEADSIWNRLKGDKGQLTIDLEPFVKLLKMRGGEPEFTAPTLRKMEASIKAGEGTSKNWTPLNQHADAFGGDELGPHTFSRMWGSTSPNTPVGRNNYESLQAWKAMLEGDIPFTNRSARSKDITMVGAKVPNLNRAVANEPLQSGRGSVGKTEAMSRLIAGKEDTHANPSIPIDVHALSGLGAGEDNIGQILPQLRKFLDEKQGKQPRTITELYNTAADVYRKGMAKFGEDVFPTMWEGIKMLKGQGQSQGLTNWLKEKGLLEPGQMVNQQALQSIIDNIDRSDFYGRGGKGSK